MQNVRHHDLPAPPAPDALSRDADALADGVRADDPAALERAGSSVDGFDVDQARRVVAGEFGYDGWSALLDAAAEPGSPRPVSRLGKDLSLYEARVSTYLSELAKGDDGAARRFRGHVPRLAGRTDNTALAAEATEDDARVVVAREGGCLTWREMTETVRRLQDRGRDRSRWCEETGPPRDLVLKMELAEPVAVRDLLSKHPDLVTRRDADGGTVLETAVQPWGLGFVMSDMAVVRELIAAGADLDRAVNLAAGFNRTDMLDVFLDAGADVTNTVEWGITPLEAAIHHGSAEATQRLAAVEVAPLSLWVAAGSNRVDLLEGFLSGGRLMAESRSSRPEPADVGWTIGPPPADDDGTVLAEAMVYACQVGATDAVTWLLDHGADIDARPAPGLTGLHFAVSAGRKDTVDLLLARGADMSIKDGQHGSTALQWAEHHADAYPDSPQILRQLADTR